MPCDYKANYPPNWKTEIVPRIKGRDGNSCKFCGLANYLYGYRDAAGNFYESEMVEDRLNREGYEYFFHELSNWRDREGQIKPPIKIILTVAHLDHNTRNNADENLVALCQQCHLRHDVEHHKKTRRKNRGLQELFTT